MQNTQKFKQNDIPYEQQKQDPQRDTENETPKGFFAKLGARLVKKDEWEVRDRISRTVGFFTAAIITYLLGGVELFFNTYPVCIALACSDRRMLPPIATGAIALVLSGNLPPIYAFGCVSVILIRALASLLPYVIGELSYSKDSDKPRTDEGNDNMPVLRRDGIPEDYKPFFAASHHRDTEESGATLKLDAEDDVAFADINDHVSSETAAENHSAINRDKDDGSAAKAGYMQALFCEKLYVRLLCAALGGLLCGIFILVQNDFSFYALYGTLFLVFACPALTLAFCGYLGGKVYKTEPRAFASFMTIAPLCIIFSLGKTVIGMPMAPFLAMLITLYISSKKGMIWGVGAALVCGVAFNFMYIPLLAFSAIIFCMISGFKPGAGLAAVCALVVIWCYYIGGSEGLISVLPPMLLAIPVYMTVDRYRRLMHAPYDRDAILSGGVFFAQAVTEKTKNEVVRDKLCALSDAFSSISETFYKLSDRLRRPDMLDPSKISDSAFSKNCEGCRQRELCHGAKYTQTLDAVKCVTVALHTKGYVEESDLSEEFRARCFKYKGLLQDVDQSVRQMTENILKGEKINLFASNYDDMTAILNDALGSDGEEYSFDTDAGERIFDLMYSQGFKLSGVAVYGKRCINVVIKGVSITDKISAKKQAELCRDIGEIVGVELTEPSFELSHDGTFMRLRSKPRFAAKCSCSRVAAEQLSAKDSASDLFVDPFAQAPEEPLCGDTVNSFISDSSYFYSLISDGMGNGAEAAFTSGVCSMFIEKMLCAGNRSDITLRLLNNIIRSENTGRGGEVSATVDLFELDLIDGTAGFIKSGAAPTYVVRGETVYKISSHTMPIGIIKDADTKLTRFDTKHGDLIIMMSDGCCPDSDDCTWLVDFLCEYTRKGRRSKSYGSSPLPDEHERLCETLISLAKKNYPKERDGDDISVCVVQIE